MESRCSAGLNSLLYARPLLVPREEVGALVPLFFSLSLSGLGEMRQAAGHGAVLPPSPVTFSSRIQLGVEIIQKLLFFFSFSKGRETTRGLPPPGVFS